jgi:hypothetical protein
VCLEGYKEKTYHPSAFRDHQDRQDHQDHHRILPVPKALDQVQSYQSARARPSVLKGSCRQTPASCRWRTISLGR